MINDKDKIIDNKMVRYAQLCDKYYICRIGVHFHQNWNNILPQHQFPGDKWSFI